MARVRAHPHPAYVKSSELRYLAVNDAYARLFDHSPADMIGLRSGKDRRIVRHGERDDPERRCLIFGNPERARFVHPFGGGSFDIALKRERLSATLSILVALFTPLGRGAGLVGPRGCQYERQAGRGTPIGTPRG